MASIRRFLYCPGWVVFASNMLNIEIPRITKPPARGLSELWVKAQCFEISRRLPIHELLYSLCSSDKPRR